MERQDQPRSRSDMEAQIVAKAWADPAFAESLRTDARAAVAKELGVQIPEGIDVEVHVETMNSGAWHLVIPPKPPSMDAELSEQELEGVTGGITWLAIANVRLLPFQFHIALDPGLGP